VQTGGSALRVYLDTSVYNRPFDDQTQPRISLETQAFVVVLQMVEEGIIELVCSPVLRYENSRNPFPLRRRWVSRCLTLARHFQAADDLTSARARELEQSRLHAIDALHLACAEAISSEYFLTCDHDVIRRYRGQMRILNPVDFVLSVMED
jgi:predicted nucleic acid-binding protein